MATNESEDYSEDEWSLLAPSYHDVFLPRFQPLYDTMASYALEKIQSNDSKDKFHILDYGTGPGEPFGTILQQLSANDLCNGKLKAVDVSQQMLRIAEERIRKINSKQITVQFSNMNEAFNGDIYDVITTSLVLPYMPNRNETLRLFFRHLRSKGLLISSHWPRPQKVPFLSVIKQVGQFMADRTRINVAELETDASFSCWPEEATRNLFASENFTIEQWIHVQLKMSFPDVRTLLSFCRICDWFQNPTLYVKAEKETKRILREEFHIEIQPDKPFELPSEVVVVVASKQLASGEQGGP